MFWINWKGYLCDEGFEEIVCSTDSPVRMSEFLQRKGLSVLQILNKEALIKAANFCAYQERTQKEVRSKLAELEVVGDEAEQIIVWLIENNYLNEERFARIFAGSKFRQKKWGRIKIKQELKIRGVSDYCLRAAMSEIDGDDYMETLQAIIEKKTREVKESNPLIKKQKIVKYALSKGFETDLVFDVVRNLSK